MVRKWRSEYNDLRQQVAEGNTNKNKYGSGRQPLILELEDILWMIADRKATCLAVFRAEIQRFVLAMVPNFDILLELKTPQNRDEYLPSVIWTFSKKVKSSTKLLKSLNVYLHSTLSLIISTSWISNFQTSMDEI